jgi:hypothetical protein
MTETDWWAATDPLRLTDWLFFDAAVADRKLRLLSVACCEPLRTIVSDSGVLVALNAAEAYADGEIDAAAMAATCNPLWRKHHDRANGITGERVSEKASRAESACLHAVMPSVPRTRDLHPDLYPYAPEIIELIDLPDRTQASFPRNVRLLHDIFGPLPFRDVAVAPAWRTSDVMLLARGIYEEKAFDRMPILADALQDAGCDHEEILSHCRATQWEHVRGCWVIDLLLGKPWREERPAPG